MQPWSIFNGGLLANSLTATFLGNGTQSSTNFRSTGYPPCDSIISAGLGDRLLLPTDPEYAARISGNGTGYWAWNSHQHPFCLVQPRDSEEVSKVMTALLQAGGSGDWHIAVRAGGHSTAGYNNIDNGVTIDLKYLDKTTYDKETNTASIGPGAHWVDVYEELDKHDVLANGGRDGDVGVGGFLLGCGNTYLMGSEGFGCDSVTNYEIALTNGSIINANKKQNSDLWVALKGGGANFGIVTRFDMETLPNTELSYRVRIIGYQYRSQLAEEFVHFTDTYESHPRDALVGFMMGRPTFKQSLMGTVQANTEGRTDSEALTRLDDIPELPAVLGTTPYKTQSLYKAALGSQLHGNRWATQACITFANQQNLLEKTYEMHEQLVKDLKEAIGLNFTTYFFFQPYPKHLADISKRKGGNMLGFESADQSAVLFTASAFVSSTEQHKVIAQAKINALVAEMKQYSRENDGATDLVHMNYADTAQDPLGSYGTKNVDFITKVANRYDPEGLFQKRFPLGFKISRVVI